MIKLQKIVVPIDFSENSKKAAQYGVEIAKDRQAKLYFLHVINQRLIDTVQELSLKGYKGDFLEAIRNMLRERDIDLRSFIPKDALEGVDVEYCIRKGKPGDEILTFAKENELDLIVIGTQGRSALKEAFMGSAARTVVNKARLPVLVVHPD